ncbi:MAG: anti-sigma factor antagonist, partial [Deltaproteobacteria bacterium CG_4_10_14_3_um_filter_51_14]
KTNKTKQKVGITGLSEHFKKIFKMVGIARLATIYDSVSEAISAL